MQVFSWKQLQNAALEEVGARLIGKTHSWNFGRNRKYFANFRNILVILIKIFLKSQIFWRFQEYFGDFNQHISKSENRNQQRY